MAEKMDPFSLIIVVSLALIFALYLWYAKIIRNKNQVYEALAGIDVQLENRSNLIPNILNIAKKFMEHERDLISSVTELRTQCAADYDSNDAKAVKEHMELASALTSEMGKLMISVEAYPELKSDKTMQQAQLSYNEVETKIAAARRFYNSAVGQLNNSIEIFPGNLVAKYVNVSAMPFFEADEVSKAPVNASSILG
jgi:LemA protein